MPGALRGSRIVDLDDEEEDRIDNLPAEDEDGLLGVDDHIVDGDLEDIDEHAAKLEAHKARKAADIGKSVKDDQQQRARHVVFMCKTQFSKVEKSGFAI